MSKKIPNRFEKSLPGKDNLDRFDEGLSDRDLEIIADQVAQYYDWLLDDKTGVGPDELLQYPHTPTQRRFLLQKMDDVLVIVAGIRELQQEVDGAVKRREISKCLQSLLTEEPSKKATDRHRRQQY
jgi:hypothetical protein